ncbi:hypothetical protein J6590_046463 [Homalodisca vitripennis]|nr:hypothetical protein J6590_046463 [Homalodisca vitripennis]
MPAIPVTRIAHTWVTSVMFVCLRTRDNSVVDNEPLSPVTWTFLTATRQSPRRRRCHPLHFRGRVIHSRSLWQLAAHVSCQQRPEVTLEDSPKTEPTHRAGHGVVKGLRCIYTLHYSGRYHSTTTHPIMQCLTVFAALAAVACAAPGYAPLAYAPAPAPKLAPAPAPAPLVYAPAAPVYAPAPAPVHAPAPAPLPLATSYTTVTTSSIHQEHPPPPPPPVKVAYVPAPVHYAPPPPAPVYVPAPAPKYVPAPAPAPVYYAPAPAPAPVVYAPAPAPKYVAAPAHGPAPAPGPAPAYPW